MTTIAQISDLHFGRHVPAMAQAVLAELRAAAPALVAVCGDLTQTASDAEFRAVRAFLDELPAPAVVVPGNHDLPGWRVWTRFARPWRSWRRHLGTDPDGLVTWSGEGVTAVGVTTARRWGPHHDWSRGRLDARQIAAVTAAFDGAPGGDLRVLVAHHPFLLTAAGRARGLVGRSGPALRHLRGRADLLLGGHVHLAYSGLVDGLVVAQSGTAFSDRLKGEPNSFNLIEATGDQLTVTARRWSGDRFESGRHDAYIRDNHRWRTIA
ncbi:metallophosphoesterase [Dactylosporangium sp. NPDC006015]|uniref:metallophosphoesterase family protein n=1 Tax=Dactylosporangium sp. NPDC006015 TaxID=3154576 RepID=UPI0033BD7751